MNKGTELQPFTFPTTGQRVRSTLINDEPWFVAADVCKALEIKNSRDALAGLDDDEKGVATTDTPGGDQQVSVINEAGLYSLILRSRKPEAKAFKRWITHEVLPAIRKTGSYSVAQKPASALEALAQTVAILQEQETRLASVEAKVEAIEGRHDWFAALGFAKLHGLPTENSYLIRVGLKASSLMRKDGLKPVKRQNAMYGEVNTYPVAYLEQAFAEVKA
ncbi:Bro-N domain-containing protein [Actinocorallia libanotica]|uniref:Bro-N domain-containing protein n=1 Tax=Actinocorallia libanotica TaxID=46162 RepID=A0ABN1Q1W9_9ACTN